MLVTLATVSVTISSPDLIQGACTQSQDSQAQKARTHAPTHDTSQSLLKALLVAL